MPAEQFDLPFHKTNTSPDRSPNHSTGPSDELSDGSSDAVSKDNTMPTSETESRIRLTIQQALEKYEDECEEADDKSGGPHPHDMLAALNDLLFTLKYTLPDNIHSQYIEQFKAVRSHPLKQSPVRELVQKILGEI